MAKLVASIVTHDSPLALNDNGESWVAMRLKCYCRHRACRNGGTATAVPTITDVLTTVEFCLSFAIAGWSPAKTRHCKTNSTKRAHILVISFTTTDFWRENTHAPNVSDKNLHSAPRDTVNNGTQVVGHFVCTRIDSRALLIGQYGIVKFTASPVG